MASERFETRTCDRCAFQTDIRKTEDAAGWSKVSGRADGSMPQVTNVEGDDFCPGCTRAFRDWRNNDEAVVQPVVVPEPIRVRPIFTIEDRKEATDLAEDIMRRVAMASGDEIALRSIRERANEVVEIVATALKAQPTGGQTNA